MGERDKFYSVTELAQEFDLTAQALRFYEEKGLLKPARSGRTRVYTYRDRARLILIIKFRRLGFALDEIVEYLNLYGTSPDQGVQYQVGLELIQKRLDELYRRRAEIDELIGELHGLEADAQRRLAASRGG